MAIRNIKELINNKGYVIKPQDRKIFEKGDLQSFFGFSRTDAIEFIIYDANDNQLPQLDGNLVRYINLTDENIRDYFLVPEGTVFQKYSLPNEYFIDVERLINEAGYSNGIFKTQVSLVNKRAGSEKEFDKLWIQEISPSRNEIRLFPLKKGVELNSELKARFDIFINGGEFREDTLQIAFEAIEKVNPNDIVPFIKSKYGDKWFSNFLNEFKITSIDSFVTKIYETFIQSSIYEFTNRYSKIGEINYGNKKPSTPSIQLSKNDIIKTIKRILIESTLHYLPERNINTKTQTVDDFVPSEDNVGKVLQTETADTLIIPTKVDVIENTVVKVNNPIEEKHIKEVIKELKDLKPDIITPDNEPDILTDGSVVLDYNNVNEAALGEIIRNTNEQVNKESTRQFFEDLRNKALNQGAPVEETRGQSTRGESAGQGNSVGQVIDGKVLKRQRNQL
jgi:hypothetical protein